MCAHCLKASHNEFFDKREAWRATSDNARRRQRRYKKRLTNRLIRQDYYEDEME